jgi:hypothetical protein
VAARRRQAVDVRLVARGGQHVLQRVVHAGGREGAGDQDDGGFGSHGLNLEAGRLVVGPLQIPVVCCEDEDGFFNSRGPAFLSLIYKTCPRPQRPSLCNQQWTVARLTIQHRDSPPRRPTQNGSVLGSGPKRQLNRVAVGALAYHRLFGRISGDADVDAACPADHGLFLVGQPSEQSSDTRCRLTKTQPAAQ